MESCTKLIFLVALAMVPVVKAGKYTGDQVFRVVPATDLQVKLLINLEKSEPERYDFWKLPGQTGRPVDIHVKSLDCANFTTYLNKTKMSYMVLAPDLQTLLDQQNDHPHFADATNEQWFLNYHGYDEIIDKIKAIVKQSSRAQLVEIGKSYEGKDQLAVKIEGSPKKHNPVFFINCGIHAREWIGPATCVYIIEQLATKYDEEPAVKATLDKIDFIILPVFNPDGYEYSRTKDRMWRKNRSKYPNKKNCIGVDLNRNFPFKWGMDVEGTSNNDPCSEIYRGPSPESELEVKNVANYLRALQNTLKAYMDIHSYSQMWMLPWGYTQDNPPDYNDLKSVGGAGIDGIRKSEGTEYQLDSSSKLLYKTSGSTKDFTYGELGVKYSYVLELRDRGDKGFILPTSQILPTALETFAGIEAMVAQMEDFSGDK